MFLLLVYVIFFSSLSTCLSWGLPSHSSRSLTGSHLYMDNWLRHCYTGSIGWRITGPSVLSNTESTLLWMDDKASSPCLKTRGTHTSMHSKSMENTSLNHSDIFILIIGTYLSLFKYLVRTTHTRLLRPPMPSSLSRPGTRQIITHTDLISNSAILCNNFVSLLSYL